LGGKLVEYLDRRGQMSRYTYDPLNRLIGESYSDALVTRTYDALGLVAYVSDSQGGDFTYIHDGAGRPLSGAGPFGTISYLRDELGRVQQRQVISQPAVVYQYDPVGNLILAAMPGASVAMAYDARNTLTTEERSNGVTSTYSYDELGR